MTTSEVGEHAIDGQRPELGRDNGAYSIPQMKDGMAPLILDAFKTSFPHGRLVHVIQSAPRLAERAGWLAVEIVKT